MDVSVVLPTYNEAGNIVELVQAILQRMPAGSAHEVIVVDDNSPDGTFAAVRDAFASNPAVVPVLRTTDRGLAKSIRAGLERSTGRHVVIMDTDFTHDPADLPRMIHVATICDVVVGSRFCAGGSMPSVYHYLLSLAYNWFIRIILRTQIQDNLSGFLIVNRDSIQGLPFDDIFFGYGDYCFRLLHYAQRAGLNIIELPVRYQNRNAGKSKSVFWQLLFSYTGALIRVRRAARKKTG